QDLKRNMAMGGGEFLASFSTLLGCEEAAKPAFFRMAQQRYERIVPSASATPIDLLVSVKREIKAEPALAAACSDDRAVARARAPGARRAAAPGATRARAPAARAPAATAKKYPRGRAARAGARPRAGGGVARRARRRRARRRGRGGPRPEAGREPHLA